MDIRLQAPFDRETAKSLHAGDYVLISGTIYTARDAAHKRMAEALAEGKELPFDIRGNKKVPQDADVQYLEADRSYGIPGLGTVQTLRSTDEGVAFYVQTGTLSLFHAGDLHWWDWPGEDPEWLAEQETVFRREIQKLAGIPIDIAFAVLDDRLEDNYAEGMELFLSVCHPRYVLPMHFWEDRTVVDRFRASYMQDCETILLDTADETHWEL